MNQDEFWSIFAETGAPTAYLLYRLAQEEKTVYGTSDHQGVGNPRNRFWG